jgi:hypothetical protein
MDAGGVNPISMERATDEALSAQTQDTPAPQDVDEVAQ